MIERNETACSKARMSLLFAVIAGLCVLLGQWTKRPALQHLSLETVRPFLPGLVELIRIENHGAAFGMLQGQIIFFYGITATICLFVVYVLYRLPERKRYMPLVINLAFLIGGALGNLCDCVIRGSVIDFFSSIPISFPVFSVVDIFITYAAAVFILLSCFYYKKEEFSFLKQKETGLEKLIIQEELADKRLDIAISLFLPGLTRVHAQKLIKKGSVPADGKPRKVSYPSTAGECLSVTLPEPEAIEVLPENVSLDILYEDKDVIVVNKPKGMVVYPTTGHTGGTLVNALLYHCKDGLPGINGILRPRIAHRIDRDMTGVMIACKGDRAHQCTAEQLKAHSITHRCPALAQGRIQEEEETVDVPFGRDLENRKRMKSGMIGGKHAVTHYGVLECLAAATYLECRLETGRTHQIRTHLALLGHPLPGDMVYGSGKNPYHLEGQCLYAAVLGFRHPADGRYLEFTAPLPTYSEALPDKFR